MKKLKRKITRARRKRRNWSRIADNTEAKAEELQQALNETYKERKKTRRRRKRLRRRIEKREAAGKLHEWADQKREELADDVDELEAIIDRLVERLDQVETLHDRAERLEKFYSKRVRRLRKKRKKMQKDKEGQLSKHFHVREFDCRDGTPVPESAIPALKALCRDVLEPLRKAYGTVHINSGYRTARYNAAIGGASNSVHIYDYHPKAVAADKVCASGSPSLWFKFTLGKADGRGLYATFTHDDNRNRIGWPDAIWYG